MSQFRTITTAECSGTAGAAAKPGRIRHRDKGRPAERAASYRPVLPEAPPENLLADELLENKDALGAVPGSCVP